MEKYDYNQAVLEDVKEYIENEVDFADYSSREDLEEYLNDVLWVDDAVTGNGSGSYTFSAWTAEENICHNLDLLSDALREFGDTETNCKILESAEACDVTIRCYLLSGAINDALDELWTEPEDTEE